LVAQRYFELLEVDAEREGFVFVALEAVVGALDG
jgi:hypothetical protein